MRCCITTQSIAGTGQHEHMYCIDNINIHIEQGDARRCVGATLSLTTNPVMSSTGAAVASLPAAGGAPAAAAAFSAHSHQNQQYNSRQAIRTTTTGGAKRIRNQFKKARCQSRTLGSPWVVKKVHEQEQAIALGCRSVHSIFWQRDRGAGAPGGAVKRDVQICGVHLNWRYLGDFRGQL